MAGFPQNFTAMAPLPTPRLSFDIIAIGGGTAGSGVIRYASRYGKKAAVVELKQGYGGTCGGSAENVPRSLYRFADSHGAPPPGPTCGSVSPSVSLPESPFRMACRSLYESPPVR
jgi:glycine/D-amino acid oxidase-like deaminating enzyme